MFKLNDKILPCAKKFIYLALYMLTVASNAQNITVPGAQAPTPTPVSVNFNCQNPNFSFDAGFDIEAVTVPDGLSTVAISKGESFRFLLFFVDEDDVIEGANTTPIYNKGNYQLQMSCVNTKISFVAPDGTNSTITPTGSTITYALPALEGSSSRIENFVYMEIKTDPAWNGAPVVISGTFRDVTTPVSLKDINPWGFNFTLKLRNPPCPSIIKPVDPTLVYRTTPVHDSPFSFKLQMGTAANLTYKDQIISETIDLEALFTFDKVDPDWLKEYNKLPENKNKKITDVKGLMDFFKKFFVFGTFVADNLSQFEDTYQIGITLPLKSSTLGTDVFDVKQSYLCGGTPILKHQTRVRYTKSGNKTVSKFTITKQ